MSDIEMSIINLARILSKRRLELEQKGLNKEEDPQYISIRQLLRDLIMETGDAKTFIQDK